METKFHIKEGLILLLVTLLMISCSSDDDMGPQSDGGPAPELKYSKITSSREVLAYYGTALNVNPGSDATLLTEFNNLYPTLPQNGDSSYTSTVSRMFTNFSARICRNSMNRDLSLPADSRIVFRFVNLSQRPDQVAGNDLERRMSAFIRLIAFRLYGVPIANDEFAVVYSFYQSQRSLVTPDATGAQDLAVQICALLGTSPRAIMKM